MGSTEELFEAIGSGDVETVRSLLAAEPDLAAARDSEGVSPWAEPNAQQTRGWTPLHSAASNGNLDLVELLLACGADPAAENDDGSNVLALAGEGGGADVIERIRIALGV